MEVIFYKEEYKIMNWDALLSDISFIANNQEHPVICRNDYDKIICSTLFRRLQDKAQVFPLDEDDYVRTRLTHSLEVSAIGKKLGEYVFGLLKQEQKDEWFETHTEKEFADVLLPEEKTSSRNLMIFLYDFMNSTLNVS